MRERRQWDSDTYSADALYLWFLVCSVLGEFPTEPVTREAHPYPYSRQTVSTFTALISCLALL
ncbi:hypothetical protein Taro_027016 [Colocasia esculenta]|uniref:Uncharacterized protein n=1 Tax=Colocasia esculenta TaxID=4460 RepID=A0A843V7M1_COLES|nr:hypothetical protein [Colocasia esculenta]